MIFLYIFPVAYEVEQLFISLFSFNCYYFIWKGETKTELSPITDWPFKCLQRPGLSQTHSRTWQLRLGLFLMGCWDAATWVTTGCPLRRHASRTLYSGVNPDLKLGTPLWDGSAPDSALTAMPKPHPEAPVPTCTSSLLKSCFCLPISNWNAYYLVLKFLHVT